jgi:hypothetical protein
MRAGQGAAIISPMSQGNDSAKVLLVADPRRTSERVAQRGTAPVRRYRLARLRFEGRATDPAARFEHLKRAFD